MSRINNSGTTYKNSNAAKNLSYLLIGGGIGATLALLFAPKSGSELREDISNVATDKLEKTRETVGQLRENVGNYYENVKEKAGNIYNATTEKAGHLADTVKKLPEKAEDLIHEKIEQIDEAVEAGQKTYQKNKQKSASQTNM